MFFDAPDLLISYSELGIPRRKSTRVMLTKQQPGIDLRHSSPFLVACMTVLQPISTY